MIIIMPSCRQVAAVYSEAIELVSCDDNLLASSSGQLAFHPPAIHIHIDAAPA
jgi:hypothetical protein